MYRNDAEYIFQQKLLPKLAISYAHMEFWKLQPFDKIDMLWNNQRRYL